MVASTLSLEAANTLLQTQENARVLPLNLRKGELSRRILDRAHLDNLMTAGIDARAGEELPKWSFDRLSQRAKPP